MNRSLVGNISNEQINTFRRSGVVCVRNVLDEEWIHRLRYALEQVPGTYADRNFMWTFNNTFKELAFDSPLGELCATFMGSKTCGLLSDIAFVKEPHSTDITPWHHDQPYYQTQGPHLCGIWLGLDPTNLHNGGLRWIRGSHKWDRIFEPDLFDGKVNMDINPGRVALPDIDSNLADYDIIHFDTEPGDCSINHSLVLHSGGPNQTANPRRAIASHYYGDKAYFKTSPPARGIEDARDLGLENGDPFPCDHKLVPRIWPKRPRAQWPSPQSWNDTPGSMRPYNDEIAGLMSRNEGAEKQRS